MTELGTNMLHQLESKAAWDISKTLTNLDIWFTWYTCPTLYGFDY